MGLWLAFTYLLRQPQDTFRSGPALKVAGWLAETAVRECPEADIVAGVATGAIAHGVLKRGQNEEIVRLCAPEAKGSREASSQIEGVLPKGSKVVVIEDLISTGMSSAACCRALRDAGAEVLGMVAIFTYGFDLAARRFEEEGVRLKTLSCYDALIEEATATGYVKESDVEVLRQWRNNPSEWNK